MALGEMIVRSTIGDLQEFKKSIIWKDIQRELYMWKKGFELELKTITDKAAETNPSTATVLMHLGDINGRIKAVDYMMSLPNIFIQSLESSEKAEMTENKSDE